MNFPGLDPAWVYSHRALHSAGLIRPWELDVCRTKLREGAKVLAVSTIALGDTVLCTPLLHALSENLGRERVGFLVRKPYRELYAGDEDAGEILTVAGKYRGWMEARKQLHTGEYRIALVANVTEPDLIPWLWHCGIRGFLRYRTRWSQWPDWFANHEMMRKPGAPDYATGHAIDNNLAMAEALNLTVTDRQIRLAIPEAGRTAAESIILIHPGASRPRKRWPLDRWIQVARALLNQEPGARVIVTGSAAEAGEAEKLAAALGSRSTSLAGKLGLLDLLKLQAGAKLFLSGDTGPYHMAVAVGCPTVTLFAPTDRGSSIEACGPRGVDGNRHAALQTVSFDDPIESISLEAVLQKSMMVLGHASPP